MLRCSARAFSFLMALASLSLGASSAQATTIDPFDQGAVMSVGPSFFTQLSLDVLGGDRRSDVSANGTLDINHLFPGMLEFSSGSALSTATVLLSYDVDAPVSLEGSDPGFFQIDVASAPDSVQIFIAVTDTNTTNKKQVLIVPASGPATLPYSAFSGIEFGSVMSVSLELLLPQPSTAIRIGGFSAIPEPATATLMGIGLLGLSLAGRRQTA